VGDLKGVTLGNPVSGIPVYNGSQALIDDYDRALAAFAE
jgi:hypothetical protein